MWIAIGIVVFLLALWLASGLVFYGKSLSRHVCDAYRRERLEPPKTDVDRELLSWEAGLNPRPESVSLLPDGKITLAGLVYRQAWEDKRWVIVAHGHGLSKEFMRYAAYFFYGMGMNVLAIDLRAHGDSGGRAIGMGWTDKADIAAWARDLETRHPGCETALYGLSLGAATVTMASGESLPESVKAVVADSGFTGAVSLFKYQCEHVFHLPSKILLPPYLLAARVFAGLRLGEVSSLEQLKKGALPILFIHGENDEFIPVSMAKTLCEAAGDRGRLHTVPGAGHGLSCVEDAGYWDMVEEFITEAFERSRDENAQ